MKTDSWSACVVVCCVCVLTTVTRHTSLKGKGTAITVHTVKAYRVGDGWVRLMPWPLYPSSLSMEYKTRWAPNAGLYFWSRENSFAPAGNLAAECVALVTAELSWLVLVTAELSWFYYYVAEFFFFKLNVT